MRNITVGQVPAQLPENALLRLKQVLELFPVSQTRWYKGVRAGEFPKPIRLWPNSKASFYRASDINDMLRRFNDTAASGGSHAGADS